MFSLCRIPQNRGLFKTLYNPSTEKIRDGELCIYRCLAGNSLTYFVSRGIYIGEKPVRGIYDTFTIIFGDKKDKQFINLTQNLLRRGFISVKDNIRSGKEAFATFLNIFGSPEKQERQRYIDSIIEKNFREMAEVAYKEAFYDRIFYCLK